MKERNIEQHKVAEGTVPEAETLHVIERPGAETLILTSRSDKHG